MKNIRENKVKRFTPFGFLKKTGIFHTIFVVFCWNIGKNVIPLFTSLQITSLLRPRLSLL